MISRGTATSVTFPVTSSVSLWRPSRNRASYDFDLLLNQFDESRRLADADDQHAGRQRIERSRMAGLFRPHEFRDRDRRRGAT